MANRESVQENLQRVDRGEDSPVGHIVGRIETALEAGEHAQAAVLLEQNLVAAWFGFERSRFGEILLALSQIEQPNTLLIRTLAQVLFSGDVDDPQAMIDRVSAQSDGVAPDLPLGSLVKVARMYMLRMEGRAAEAWALRDQMGDHRGVLRPVFDRDRGWGLMLAVQDGITAMLAGDFQSALDCFTQARMHVAVPTLSFLTRDACVKAAMLESQFGDEDRARQLLKEAEAVPHSGSWVEETLDAAYTITASRVLATTPEESLAMLEAMPLQDLGEIWPFYVIALQQALLSVGDVDESEHRLAMLERLPLARRDGEGFQGSALPMTRALNLMLQNRIPEARQRLAQADGSLVVTRVLQAVLELVAGRPQEALSLCAGLHKEVRGLRFLEVLRYAVLAGSHFALGDEAACAEVLEYAVNRPGGISARERRYFMAEVSEFAEGKIAGWPKADDAERFGRNLFSLDQQPLTPREVEVVQGLAGGQTREEITKAQFISMNTLKFHLRSVYRKLGVKSRTAAVLEAERRGLI